MKYELILASESPRRRQLLAQAGFQFQVHPPKISETLKENLNVEAQILDLAQQKAEACLSRLPPSQGRVRLVIAADTMVVFDGEALGKPASAEDACQVLRRLSGKTHEVMTGVCLRLENSQIGTSWVETTRVHFRALSEVEIQTYVATGEPLDKAGSYGIQGSAGHFVRRIEGSYTNVIGLPIEKLTPRLLEVFGVSPSGVTPPPTPTEILRQIPRHVQVVAVSKTQSSDRIRQLYQEQTQMDFGENYVQEALPKLESLQEWPLRWHFIGHLQSNKAKFVVGRFDLIHSVDSLNLATKISALAVEASLRQAVLFEINLASETSKSGFSLSSFRDALPSLVQLPGLEIRGLMTMPPLAETPEDNRHYFRELRHLSSELQKFIPSADDLSMGTSSDYPVAIEEGATLIRLGTSLFGARSR